MALRPVLLSVRLEGSQSSTGAQLGQKYNTMEADLSVTAVLPLRSAPFWFVQRSPSQAKRLVLRWNYYKVIPACCVTKGICSVHYTGPAFGTGKPEEGPCEYPSSVSMQRRRADPASPSWRQCLLCCVPGGPMDSVHSDTGSLPRYFVHMCLWSWAWSCNYSLRFHNTTSPGDIYGSDM